MSFGEINATTTHMVTGFMQTTSSPSELLENYHQIAGIQNLEPPLSSVQINRKQNFFLPGYLLGQKMDSYGLM